jgi:alkylated DNA nucleotide flippase Atl1
MRKKKSCREKLADAKDLPKVVAITPGMRKQWGTGTVVIPAPAEVDEIMKRVPKGKLITINDIRNILARRHGATIGCPITTGLFARIAAGAAEEDKAQGKKRITPYWRTLKVGGELNTRYPGGIEGQKERLKEEGHKIISRGKRFFVRNYEHALVTF